MSSRRWFLARRDEGEYSTYLQGSNAARGEKDRRDLEEFTVPGTSSLDAARARVPQAASPVVLFRRPIAAQSALAGRRYRPSIASWYFSMTNLRFTFRLGVISPAASVNSAGRMAKALMLS